MDPIFNGLNPKQAEAVHMIDGYVLTLAGAGSGKTKVLTHRLAYLISLGVQPWNIMAVTFTNKAANEMAERIKNIVGDHIKYAWIGTFHSLCLRIIAIHGSKIGIRSNFTIFDDKEQLKIIVGVAALLGYDEPDICRAIKIVVSLSKNKLETPQDWRESDDKFKKKYAEVYQAYEDKLTELNGLDFDDLILKTLHLLNTVPDIREYYQQKFKYILVDEYQDVNPVQYHLIKLLSDHHHNLFAVGDPDQSIYLFRGADVDNILSFTKDFPDAKVVMLEQNYRSTSNILAAANMLIANNVDRFKKALWTNNSDGSPVTIHICENEYEEAEWIVGAIQRYAKIGNYPLHHFAILYRMNYQSRLIEEALLRARVPYDIIGSLSFYERKEIKDILAYLRILNNDLDVLAFSRIINVPKRGIGVTTITKLEQFAQDNNISFSDTLKRVDEIDTLKKNAKEKIHNFNDVVENLTALAHTEGITITSIVETILNITGYRAELEEANTDESENRLANIDEFLNLTSNFDKKPEPTLSGFLADVSLITDTAENEDHKNTVKLMTLHSAKGLEFPIVFMAGMEEGIFPHYKAISSREVEEERRLCYVGMTRAKQYLYMTAVKERRKFFGVSRAEKQTLSRFLRELPQTPGIIRII